MADIKPPSGWPPLVLAGPILRRCEPEHVWIWLASSQPMVVTALIFDTATLTNGLRDLAVGFPPTVGGGAAATVEFGQNLHVALVEAVPQQGEFRAGRILGYDLRFELLHSSAPFTWLSRTNPELAYSPYVVPTFHLPQPSRFVPTLMHGSCRKLHGPGSDALGLIDDTLRQTRDLAGRRPHAVLLTGDQIYADDVADGLSAYISDLAKRLLGGAESLPFLGGTKLLPEIDGAHARWMIPEAFFTPDDPHDRNKSTGRNQLLGFSEFAAMYLLAWSEANWPDAILSDELEATRGSLTKVRRALANIASYMLLDDHEVTDDWNLNRRWEMTVNSPYPRRVIANGVAAYWVFQAWGNDPQTFVPRGLNEVIAAHLQRERQVEQHREYGGPTDTIGKRYDTSLLGAHWDFVAPTQPPAIFIDSRTQRDFPPANSSGGLNAPAALLNDAGLKTLDQALGKLEVRGKTVILVAATPVFGIPAIEAGIALAVRTGAESPAGADFENWHINGDGFLSLLTLVHRHRPATCILLSGDVHYAFGIRAFFRRGGYATPFVQVTSSSLKNEPKGFLQKLLQSLGGLLEAGEWQFKTPLPPHFEDNGEKGAVFSRMLALTDKTYFWLQSNLGALSVDRDTARLTFYAGDGGKHTPASVTLSVPLGEIPG